MNSLSLSWKPFQVRLDRFESFLKSTLENYDGMICDETSCVVLSLQSLSPEEITAIEDYWGNLTEVGESSLTQAEIRSSIQKKVSEYIAFGDLIIAEMAAENILLGITELNMTNHVRKVTSEIVSALRSGSLKDAIYEARQIANEDKDSTFITDVRLLSFINRVEEYLELPLSETL